MSDQESEAMNFLNKPFSKEEREALGMFLSEEEVFLLEENSTEGVNLVNRNLTSLSQKKVSRAPFVTLWLGIVFYIVLPLSNGMETTSWQMLAMGTHLVLCLLWVVLSARNIRAEYLQKAVGSKMYYAIFQERRGDWMTKRLKDCMKEQEVFMGKIRITLDEIENALALVPEEYWKEVKAKVAEAEKTLEEAPDTSVSDMQVQDPFVENQKSTTSSNLEA